MTAAPMTQMRLLWLLCCPRGRPPPHHRPQPWVLARCRLRRGAQGFEDEVRSRGHSDQNWKVIYPFRQELPSPQLSALLGFSLGCRFAACVVVCVGILKPLLHVWAGFQFQPERHVCPGWGQPRVGQTHAPGGGFLATVGLELGRAALSGATQRYLLLPASTFSDTTCPDLHPVSRSGWTRRGHAFQKRGT